MSQVTSDTTSTYATEPEDRLPRVNLKPGPRPWQKTLFVIIFESDTPLGKLFDLVLLVIIALSVLIVMAESVTSVRQEWGGWLYGAEWIFTVLFTIEYILRLVCVRRKRTYALSFFGVVDLLAILPTYISVLVPGAQGLATIRAVRLLRIFRVLKLARFASEAAALQAALWHSRAKLAVFLLAVLIAVTIIGSAMYLVEGQTNPGFRDIPSSIYWAIVTMATVGYGDTVPMTPAGKFFASVLIVFGYSMIVVPTGILTAEWSGRTADAATRRAMAEGRPTRDVPCSGCGKYGHDPDARFCKHCGGELH